jgi:DNA-binding HxlR family transcriptional regulator
MRSYGQYCALAKALDVIGDRWTLLIVRELLFRGPCRYTDLRQGLPGIATNLLAERLRELDSAGLIETEAAVPPVATTLYRLTERGADLEPVLRALGRWGAPLMIGAEESDEFRSHWLTFPVSEFLTDQTPGGPPFAIELRSGQEPVTIEGREGTVSLNPRPVPDPGLVLSAGPQVLVGFLTGYLDLDTARERGMQTAGDVKLLRRLRPTIDLAA